MARTIKLTKGHVTIVDDKDFEFLSRHRWKALVVKGGRVYAARTQMLSGRWPSGCRRSRVILMHREILKADTEHVDHKNTDSLDNRRKNLRFATHQQNGANSRKTRGRSRFKGVYWNKEKQKWQAQIGNGMKGERQSVRYLGRFDDEEDAARAYDRAAKKMHGEFARLNFRRGP